MISSAANGRAPEKEHTNGSFSANGARENTEQPFVDTLASILTIVDIIRAQFAAITTLTSLEARLSLRCIMFVLVASSCFGVVLVGLWLTALFAVAFSLYAAGLSIWLVGTLCLLAQVLVLYLIYRTLLYLVQKIGFSETISAVKIALGKEK